MGTNFYLNSGNEDGHIGKRSAGWKFVLNIKKLILYAYVNDIFDDNKQY